jgi:hypothetical protein
MEERELLGVFWESGHFPPIPVGLTTLLVAQVAVAIGASYGRRGFPRPGQPGAFVGVSEAPESSSPSPVPGCTGARWHRRRCRGVQRAAVERRRRSKFRTARFRCSRRRLRVRFCVCRLTRLVLAANKDLRYAGLFTKPFLTDSNRRPPPYYGASHLPPIATGCNRWALSITDPSSRGVRQFP